MAVDLSHMPVQIMVALVILAASTVEFSFAADMCDHKSYSGYECSERRPAWAVACGVVSAALSIILIALAYYRHKTGANQVSLVYIDIVIAVILVIFWVFGAVYNTKSDGIFASPSNGYFSTWVAFFASVYYLHLTLAAFNSKLSFQVNLRSPIIVFIASAIFMSTAADVLHNGVYTDGDRVKWAVACGVISMFFTMVQLILLYTGAELAGKLAKPLAVFLVLLWAPGAGVATYAKGPFVSTGNGYFSAWLAFGASLYYAYLVFFGGDSGTSLPVTHANASSQPTTTAAAPSSPSDVQRTTVHVATPTSSSV